MQTLQQFDFVELLAIGAEYHVVCNHFLDINLYFELSALVNFLGLLIKNWAQLFYLLC